MASVLVHIMQSRSFKLKLRLCYDEQVGRPIISITVSYKTRPTQPHSGTPAGTACTRSPALRPAASSQSRVCRGYGGGTPGANALGWAIPSASLLGQVWSHSNAPPPNRRVFRRFVWLEVNSGKMGLSRPGRAPGWCPIPPRWIDDRRECRDHQSSSGCYATDNANCWALTPNKFLKES